MKRLLAYLIVVLALGLMFNFNVNAETKPKWANKYKYCLKKDFSGKLDDLNGIGQTSTCDNTEYEIDYDTHHKISMARHKIAKSKKSKNFWEENYKSTKRILEEYLKKKKNKTQIAKAESNQNKNASKKISVACIMPSGSGSLNSRIIVVNTEWARSCNKRNSIFEKDDQIAFQKLKNYFETRKQFTGYYTSAPIRLYQLQNLLPDYDVDKPYQVTKITSNKIENVAKVEPSQTQKLDANSSVYKFCDNGTISISCYTNETSLKNFLNEKLSGNNDSDPDRSLAENITFERELNNVLTAFKVYNLDTDSLFKTISEISKFDRFKKITNRIKATQNTQKESDQTQKIAEDKNTIEDDTFVLEACLHNKNYSTNENPLIKLRVSYNSSKKIIKDNYNCEYFSGIKDIKIAHSLGKLNQVGATNWNLNYKNSKDKNWDYEGSINIKSYDYILSLNDRISKIYPPLDYNKKTQFAETDKIVVPKKKVEIAKVEEPKQEEFKPENKDIDNDAPIIDIAQNIIVDSQSYTLKGKVKDQSRFFLTIDDRPIKVAKNGQFEFEGFAIDSKEQLKIVAIDRWKNKSEKIINVEVKLKQVADLRSYEKPNPSKIKVKKDNNKIGIIIGIEKYQNLNNIDAPYANRDAKAFKAYANIALGIPSNNLKVLIDEDATRGELLKSLKIWLPQITRGEKKDIYIFFAGHGLASDNGEDLHILPHNGDPILLEDTALSRIEMFDLINKVNPKSVTMFFDTCYSGQTRSEQMLIAGLRPVRIVADEQETPNNFTIFTASDYDQTSGSINEAEHGIFSYYLMKGLEGKADENSDKKITNGELISYLKNNVTQEAFSQNRSQEPMLSGDPDKVLISYR